MRLFPLTITAQTKQNTTVVIILSEPIQTYLYVVLFHASIFQIIKTKGLPLFWSDELSKDVLCRSRNCQKWYSPNTIRIITDLILNRSKTPEKFVLRAGF